MMALPLPRSALRALLVRAVVLWVLLRIVISGAALFAATGSTQPVSSRPNAIAAFLLNALLSVVDLRRRHEGALWSNLGVSTWHITLLFALVAAAGEALLAAIIR